MSIARLGLVLASLAAPALAGDPPTTILTVPGDSDTIQGAVDMAGPGTLIKVKKGLYEESVVIQGKTDLTLAGKGKPVVLPGQGNTAIAISGCTNVVVQGFKLEHGAFGVDLFDSTDCTVAKCQILDMEFSGVYAVECSFLLVEKNKVDGAGDHGLDIGDLTGVNDCTISKNKVLHTGGHGIVIGGDNNLAEKNKVSETDGHGIETRSTVSSNDNVIRKNTVKDVGTVGLLANGTGNVFEKNKVNGTAEHGMLIVEDATGNTFLSNTIGKAGEVGVSVLGDGNAVTGNKVSKADIDGFSVGGDNNTFESNKSAKAGSDGFHVSGTGNTFTKNKATGSIDLDLQDENAAGANTYTDNTFPKNNLDL